MHRIQRVSKIVKLVAYALCGVCLLVVLLMVWSTTKLPGSEPNGEAVRWVAVATGAASAVLAVVFYQLARLAELYERGELFGVANVRHLRAIGVLLLLTTVGVRLGYDEAAGHAMAQLDVNIGSVVAGFVFVFMSWVMDEARKLDEEHGLTI